MASRETLDSPWEEPLPIEELNTEFLEGASGVTEDGRTLVFVSDRPEGGQGKNDLWLAHRAHEEEPWGEPRNLREINTSVRDTFGAISPDGRAVFWSPIIGGRPRSGAPREEIRIQTPKSPTHRRSRSSTG